MKTRKIDRENIEDIYKQIGRTEEVISQHNRKQQKWSDEISNWPKKKEHLEKRIAKSHLEISKRHEYIKLLEGDIERLKKIPPKGWP